MAKAKKVNSFKFTISSRGGDGAYLCNTSINSEIYEYFKKRDLDLEAFALDDQYAKRKRIPIRMQPFSPGSRAEFGLYECGMTASDSLEIDVRDSNSKILFSGKIPKGSLKQDLTSTDLIKNYEKGIYVAGYEGLEDCYIDGKFELDSKFDIKKFIIYYKNINYQVGDRDMISSITYDKNETEWGFDSYEGTGDNYFEFVIVD